MTHLISEELFHVDSSVPSLSPEELRQIDACWRAANRPIACLNYLLTSHVWRQDHNGFGHKIRGSLMT